MVLRPRARGKVLCQYIVPPFCQNWAVQCIETPWVYVDISPNKWTNSGGYLSVLLLRLERFFGLNMRHTYYEFMNRNMAEAMGTMVVSASCGLPHEIYQPMIMVGWALRQPPTITGRWDGWYYRKWRTRLSLWWYRPYFETLVDTRAKDVKNNPPSFALTAGNHYITTYNEHINIL